MTQTTKMLGMVDALGYFWCAACAAVRQKTPDRVVAETDGESYENDRCDGCGKLVVLTAVHPRRYKFAAAKFRKGDAVRVGPRYVMGGGSERDEYTGGVYYVVEVSGFIVRPGGPADYGLAAHPDDDAAVWIIEGRLAEVPESFVLRLAFDRGRRGNTFATRDESLTPGYDEAYRRGQAARRS